MDKWEDPYRPDGRTTKVWARNKFGVYFIRRKDTRRVVYIGMSRYCLYKVLYRHFHKWVDKRQYRVTYHGRADEYEVRCLVLPKDWVEYIEIRLIKYCMPPDNLKYYPEIVDPMVLRPVVLAGWREDLPF